MDTFNLYAIAGKRVHAIWRIDGSFSGLTNAERFTYVNPPGGGEEGIWDLPIKLADHVHAYVWDEEFGKEWVESKCIKFVSKPGYVEHLYFLPRHRFSIKKTVFVPENEEALVLYLDVTNSTDKPRNLHIFFDCEANLKYAWPEGKPGPDICEFDEQRGAIISYNSVRKEWTAIFGGDIKPARYYLGKFNESLIENGTLAYKDSGTSKPSSGRSCLEYHISLKSRETRRIKFIVAGSSNSRKEALKTFDQVSRKTDLFFKEKLSFYDKLITSTTQIESPDFTLNKAFTWAKIAMEMLKLHQPSMGYGYMAGLPFYNRYFTGDSSVAILGELCIGNIEYIKKAMKMILKYQAKTFGPGRLPGELFHELSTTGYINYYNCGSTMGFPEVIMSIYKWTGDKDLLKKYYSCILKIMEWYDLRDKDKDGLIENGPEGFMADDSWEDRNVEKSNIKCQVSWYRDLIAASKIAEALGKEENAKIWRKKAEAIFRRIHDIYWDDLKEGYHVTLRPDGSLDLDVTIPLSFAGTVDEGRTKIILDNAARNAFRFRDYHDFLKMKKEQAPFSKTRGYMAYYVVGRGVLGLTFFKNHYAEAGQKILEEIINLPFQNPSIGLFPETLRIIDPVTKVSIGCFNQAFSIGSGVFRLIIEGLLGIEPDAPNNAVKIDPHLPPKYPYFKIRNLKIGSHHVDINYERKMREATYTITNRDENPLHATVGFVVPKNVEIKSIKIGDESLGMKDPRVNLESFMTDNHLYIETSIPSNGKNRVSVSYQHWNAYATTKVTPQTITAGMPVTISATVTNRTDKTLHGTLLLEILDTEIKKAKIISLPIIQTRSFDFDLETAHLKPGYYTISIKIRSDQNHLSEDRCYLRVVKPHKIRIEGRSISKVKEKYVLEIFIDNNSFKETRAQIKIPSKNGFLVKDPVRLIKVPPHESSSCSFIITPMTAGTLDIPIEVSLNGTTKQFVHKLKVVDQNEILVLYSGFLEPPIKSEKGLYVVHIPANYAVRVPKVLSHLMPHIDVLLLSDSQDSKFDEGQVLGFINYVKRGGTLILIAYWSPPWGRGFYHCYNSLASTALSEILPLKMMDQICLSKKINLTDEGHTIFADICQSCPPIHYNKAIVREGAKILAESENGDPLIVMGRYGNGNILVFTIDFFGDIHETFHRWENSSKILKKTIYWLKRENFIC